MNWLNWAELVELVELGCTGLNWLNWVELVGLVGLVELVEPADASEPAVSLLALVASRTLSNLEAASGSRSRPCCLVATALATTSAIASAAAGHSLRNKSGPSEIGYEKGLLGRMTSGWQLSATNMPKELSCKLAELYLKTGPIGATTKKTFGLISPFGIRKFPRRKVGAATRSTPSSTISLRQLVSQLRLWPVAEP